MTHNVELTDWETLLIEQAVQRMIDSGEVSKEHAEVMLDKIDPKRLNPMPKNIGLA